MQKSHTEWKILEKSSHIILTDDLEIHIISLPKILKLVEKGKLSKNEEKLKNWCQFLLTPKKVEVKNMSKEDEDREEIQKALDILNDISSDEHERYLAEQRIIQIRDRNATEEFGYDRGLEEGIKQGLEKGIKSGIEQTVKGLLENNVEIEIIEKSTGLSKEKILEIKEKL